MTIKLANIASELLKIGLDGMMIDVIMAHCKTCPECLSNMTQLIVGFNKCPKRPVTKIGTGEKAF